MSYIDRMVAERDELENRILKLKDFIDSPKFKELDVFEEQHPLLLQHDHMFRYHEILSFRVEIAQEKNYGLR